MLSAYRTSQQHGAPGAPHTRGEGPDHFSYLSPDSVERALVRGAGFDPNGVGITTRGQTLRCSADANPLAQRIGTRNKQAKGTPLSGRIDAADATDKRGRCEATRDNGYVKTSAAPAIKQARGAGRRKKQKS